MKASSSNRNENKPTKVDTSNRRNFLKVTGAALVAASVPSVAAALPDTMQRDVYLQACGWNHALPGVFGQVCMTVDVRAQLGGTGLGTFRDDVHPEINSQFQITSARRRGDEYTLQGQIVSSRDPAMVGMPVRISVEVDGDRGNGTITVGPTAQPLVVIAIIGILIGLLLPVSRT